MGMHGLCQIGARYQQGIGWHEDKLVCHLVKEAQSSYLSPHLEGRPAKFTDHFCRPGGVGTSSVTVADPSRRASLHHFKFVLNTFCKIAHIQKKTTKNRYFTEKVSDFLNGGPSIVKIYHWSSKIMF